MNFRSAVFWTRDLILGGQIRAELRDVEFLNSRSAGAAQRRLDLLDEHLAYVTTKVPYYRDLRGADSLTDFPVLGKEDMRSHQSRMIARGLDTTKLHVASTSGSTGTPFRVYQDTQKRRRIDAEAIYFGRLAGYQIGNPLWHLKLWTGRNSRTRLSAFARNIYPVDVSAFNSREALLLLDQIRAQRGCSSIISYSSSLETIARALNDDDKGAVGSTKVASIVGQSEPLSSEAREILWRTFGVCPVARYGMEETGVLAQQRLSLEGSYEMNLASQIVEVLRLDDNSSASPGELGRVVVTDLFNKAQPMIRYDSGDLAVVGKVEAETGFADSLERLDGRSRERLYDVEDKPLAPMIAYKFWWKFPEILQYQIVQRGRAEYTLRVDVDENFNKEAELVREFRNQVGNNARIDIEYNASGFYHVSGKRKVIVAEYVPFME